MKKFIPIFLIITLLAGCSSLPPLLATRTPTPPVETATPFISETPIPTQNLFATSTPTPLTFTPTVTVIGAELFSPTPSETGFPTNFPTPNVSIDPNSGGYFTPQSKGFLAVLISSDKIYWNEGPCMPRNVKISAFVEDQINTNRVLLFMRLREKKNTLNITKWGAGAWMVKEDNGSYNYNVRTFNIFHYYYFVDAWLEYQLVAVNKDADVIGRTPIYDRNISLLRCRPVP